MKPPRSLLRVGMASVIANCATAAVAFAQPCAPGWDLEFGASGFNGQINDFQPFDDGAGMALYACGQFTSINGQPVGGVARWDGRDWTEVGGGLSRHDQYTSFGFGMCVWDDGHGPALYVGGSFTEAGGVPVNNIARWDGHEWSALGTGTDEVVQSLGTFDDGRGEALYVGGVFQQAGEQPAAQIARWDGTQWEPVGEGFGPSWSDGVHSLLTFDDGSGSALYAGGGFSYVGQMPVHLIARWDGQAWSPVGKGDELRSNGVFSHVDEMAIFDDGSGPALYVTGQFTTLLNGVSTSGLARWNGTEWSFPGVGIGLWGLNHPDGIAVFDDGAGPALWVAGYFHVNGSEFPNASVASWDGTQWRVPDQWPDNWVNTLAAYNDGFGEALYLGGPFSHLYPSNSEAHGVIRWTTPHATIEYTDLRAGEPARFTTTCSTPGRRVYFAYSTAGLGSFFVSQLNVTLDLDHPHLAGFGIADQDGRAELVRRLPPNSAGMALHLQAAEQGRKSEVVEATIE